VCRWRISGFRACRPLKVLGVFLSARSCISAARTPNAEAVRRHKGRAIIAVHLVEFGDDARLPPRQGNPQALSYKSESDENPRNCWALKPLKDVANAAAES
jgi:hypothetical protein